MTRRVNVLNDTELLLRLDEVAGGTAVDLGVNGLDFTNVGSTAIAVSNEPFVYARNFVRASGQYLYCDGVTALHSEHISIEAVVKLTTLPAEGEKYAVYTDYLTGGYGVGCMINGEAAGVVNLYFGCFGGNVWEWFVTDITSLVDTTAYHRYTWTYDGTVMRVYFDGLEVGNFTKLTSGDIGWSASSRASVGAFYNTGHASPLGDPRYMNGNIAEVRVNGSITDAPLKPWEIYNGPAAVSDPQVGFEVDDDTVCCHNFNNVAEGTLVHDDKLNDNTALDLHYKLNDDAATTVILDDTATLNGVLYGGKTTADMSEAGKLGTALRFDGAADYVDIPDTFDPTAYTIACWVKLDDATDRSIIRRASVNPPDINYSHALRVVGGVFSHYIFDGAIRAVTGTTSVVADTWYHVAITAKNNGYMRLYVNGVEEGTADAIGTMWTGGNRWIFGYSYATQSLGWLDGVLDDLRFYWDALSTGEIYKLWNGGAGIDTSYQYEAHMGSVVGTVPLVPGPVSKNSRDFPMDNNRCVIPYSADFTVQQDFCLEVWFQPDLVNTLHFIVGKAQVNLPGFSINQKYSAGNILVASMYDGSQSATSESGGILVVGGWYYAAYNWDSSEKTSYLFVNGSLFGYNTNPSVNLAAVDAATYDYVIGGANNDAWAFDGRVAAARFSSRMRTPKEIYDYYNGSNVQGVE